MKEVNTLFAKIKAFEERRRAIGAKKTVGG